MKLFLAFILALGTSAGRCEDRCADMAQQNSHRCDAFDGKNFTFILYLGCPLEITD